MEITLKQLTERIKQLSEDYDVWIEGKGDSSIKLVIEDKYFIIKNDTK
jgi:hypothetical protein